ncbi:hypothetical protein [Veillonella sp. T34266-5]|uniref:hypothetical protein n=1 Tax=Veillonella sp. T34266-5 TaxID=2027457 RepID=UPI001E44E7DC|nr:hypothetical protein [Veillonella sp. T34266-5]
MNGINWTHLVTLTLSPKKGSSELKTNGALNEALPMGIIAYVVMAILTYLIACITISIVSYSFFTIVNDTLRMYKNDDIRMYNFNCITDTIVEVITTCNTYTLLTVHLL